MLLFVFSSQAYAQSSIPTPVQGQNTPTVHISFPIPDQPVQGIVNIVGSSSVDGFQRAELFFSYHENPSNTWFLIHSSTIPVINGVLARWDTTTITDGVYTLRLTITRENGNQITSTVERIRVRNYTPLETYIPVQTRESLPREAITQTTAFFRPSPTPLPSNPAQFTQNEIGASISNGALFTLLLFGILGLFWIIRAPRYRE